MRYEKADQKEIGQRLSKQQPEFYYTPKAVFIIFFYKSIVYPFCVSSFSLSIVSVILIEISKEATREIQKVGMRNRLQISVLRYSMATIDGHSWTYFSFLLKQWSQRVRYLPSAFLARIGSNQCLIFMSKAPKLLFQKKFKPQTKV